MKYKVYALNEISRWESNNKKGRLVYVELMELGKPGGEAFSINVIETGDQHLADHIEEDTVYVKEFNEQKVIGLLQDFINSYAAQTWDELKNSLLQLKWV